MLRDCNLLCYFLLQEFTYLWNAKNLNKCSHENVMKSVLNLTKNQITV